MQAALVLPKVPQGAIKNIGDFGPKYQVGPLLRQANNGDWLVEITLVDSGEKTEYYLSHLNNDPDAR